jgi:hypothetical protein
MAYKKTNNIMIEDARLIFKNFSGEESKFNRAGNKNFCVVLDHDMADDLAAEGWNIKYLRPREDGEEPTPYLQVTVAYGNIPPKVIMIAGRNKTPLDSLSIGTLDYAEIANVDLVIRPYNWEVNGKQGIKAYLKTMYVEIEQDAFASKYDFDDDEVVPF